MTDTAADLSPKVLQEEAIGLVPIYVRLGEKRYKDWQELTPDALYQAMRAGLRSQRATISLVSR